MDWIETMNAALDYIESRLDGEISHSELARLTKHSAYHFQRVFSYMAGVTLAEYVRRRKLTRAAVDLHGGNEKVIDVALKYGYESPTAFTRAFQNFHGITPNEAKRGGTVTAYPPLSFQITIKGVTAMQYRIEEKEAFRIVGPKLETTSEGDRALQEIPAFWGEVARSGAVPELCEIMDGEPRAILGVCVGSFQESLEFDYYAAAPSTKPAPEGMGEYTVPACTWAIFECTGPMPHSIQELTARIVREWLPTSGYEYGNGPDIEVYSDGDNTRPDFKSWVWMPVVKK